MQSGTPRHTRIFDKMNIINVITNTYSCSIKAVDTRYGKIIYSTVFHCARFQQLGLIFLTSIIQVGQLDCRVVPYTSSHYPSCHQRNFGTTPHTCDQRIVLHYDLLSYQSVLPVLPQILQLLSWIYNLSSNCEAANELDLEVFIGGWVLECIVELEGLGRMIIVKSGNLSNWTRSRTCNPIFRHEICWSHHVQPEYCSSTGKGIIDPICREGTCWGYLLNS